MCARNSNGVQGESYVITLSWQETETLVDVLASQVKHNRYPIQKIYAIPRGGLVVATMLAHKLGVGTVLTPLLGTRIFEGREGVLIVDDIVDSGKALQEICRRFPGAYTASLLLRKRSDRIPSWYAQLIETDDWVQFPWEVDPKRDQEEYKFNALQRS